MFQKLCQDCIHFGHFHGFGPLIKSADSGVSNTQFEVKRHETPIQSYTYVCRVLLHHTADRIWHVKALSRRSWNKYDPGFIGLLFTGVLPKSQLSVNRILSHCFFLWFPTKTVSYFWFAKLSCKSSSIPEHSERTAAALKAQWKNDEWLRLLWLTFDIIKCIS